MKVAPRSKNQTHIQRRLLFYDRRISKRAPLREGGGKYPVGHIPGGSMRIRRVFARFTSWVFDLGYDSHKPFLLALSPPMLGKKHRQAAPLPEGGYEGAPCVLKPSEVARTH